MDNLISYTQKINKRQHRPVIPKKQSKRLLAVSSSFLNIFKSLKSSFKKKPTKNKSSYKPFMIHDRTSNSQYYKNYLKGQYIILPQKVVNHVSNIIKTNNEKNVINLAKQGFFKKIKPVLIKFSIFNIFVLAAGLLVFISTSIYSSTFIQAGTITFPNDNSADYLI